jgi:hypothetical protein
MLKQVSNYTHPPQARQEAPLPERGRNRKETGGVPSILTRPALSRPRPTLSPRYVEDSFEGRAKLVDLFQHLDK